jgi:hypothetical protein
VPTPACVGGIRAVSYHLPFTYLKKLSPGLREESIPCMAVTFLTGVVLQAARKSNEAKRNNDLFINRCLMYIEGLR